VANGTRSLSRLLSLRSPLTQFTPEVEERRKQHTVSLPVGEPSLSAGRRQAWENALHTDPRRDTPVPVGGR
jgi:hypothetical protein